METKSKKLIDSLADCVGFLIISRELSSAPRSYIFESEHWGAFNRSLKTVYDNYEQLIPFLESVEQVFLEVPASLSQYISIEKNGLPIDHPDYREMQQKFKNYFKDFEYKKIIDSPEQIHSKIKDTDDPQAIRKLFAFYVDKLGNYRGQIHEYLRNKSTSIEDLNTHYSPFEIGKQGQRLSNTLIQLFKLSEIHQKLVYYNYVLDLEKLDFFISGNIDDILSYLSYRYIRIKERNIRSHLDELTSFRIEKCLSESISLLAKSNIYQNKQDLGKLNKLIGLLDKLNYKANLEFNNPKISNFRCILFERAENAYKYGLISQKRFNSYQKKLKGIEKEQIIKSREDVEKLNYLKTTNTPPIFRSMSWSDLNTSYYKNELKLALRGEQKIGINLSSGFYQNYIGRYVKEIVVEAYGTLNKAVIEEAAEHLARVFGMYDWKYSFDVIKGMFLDAGAIQKYIDITNAHYESFRLDELISVQRKFKKEFPLTGKLLLSFGYWERQKNLVQLFEDDIISFLDLYIDKNSYQFLPIELLEKYTDKDYVSSKFDTLKKQWIEENDRINFPYQKKQVLQEIYKLELDSDKHEPYNDIYRSRFDILRDHNLETELEFVEIPKLELPYAVWEFLRSHLSSLVKTALDEFKEKENLKIGDDRWVSEKHLYYRIKEHFPDIPVVHHSSPPWLGQQQFDIYLPVQNIAIEYNGRQHYEAVSFFGGEEGLEYRKKLDEEKLHKARKNNCTVIIHKYDDSIDKTLTKLMKFLNIKK